MHAANLQRDMVRLIDFVDESSKATIYRQRRLRATYERMKKTLDEIQIRPEKGRRKDLKKIEQAVRSMMKLAFDKNANA